MESLEWYLGLKGVAVSEAPMALALGALTFHVYSPLPNTLKSLVYLAKFIPISN